VVRIAMKAGVTTSALIEQIARGGASIPATCVTTQLATASTIVVGGGERAGL
jgi:hypothetical protein